MINILFAVYNLSVWDVIKIVCKLIGLYEMFAKIYPCWDCIQHVCKVVDVVDMFYKDIISANDVYILLIGWWDC